VALIGSSDRFQNSWVNSGVVVTGKGACGLHSDDNVTVWSAADTKGGPLRRTAKCIIHRFLGYLRLSANDLRVAS
jgi:hypothetical protein